MTTYNISDWSTLVSNSPYTSGDVINLTTDFTVANDSNIISLTDCTIQGTPKSVELTFASGRTIGIFQSDGATIEDIRINGGGNTLVINEGAFIAYSASVQDQTVTINKCRVSNITVGEHGGGFIASFATDNEGSAAFSECSAISTTLAGHDASGFVGLFSKNITITNCYGIITMSGSFNDMCGFISEGIQGTTSISNSYISVNELGTNRSAGLMGNIHGASGTFTISKCYVLAGGDGISGSGSSGLIYGIGTTEQTPSGADNNTVTINDCYIVGTITTSADAGPFVANYTVGSSNSITINRCYHWGSDVTFGSGTVVGNYDSDHGTFNINNSVILFDNAPMGGTTDQPTADEVSRNFGNDIFSGGDLPDGTGTFSYNGFADWSSFTSTWTAGTSGNFLPTLDVFAASPWDGTYDDAEDTPNLLSGGGSGDPHITTLNGDFYDYDVIGNCQLFHCDDKTHGTFTINAYIDNPPTHQSQQNPPLTPLTPLKYFRQVYIYYNGAELDFDMGFRGQKLKVIHDTGGIQYQLSDHDIHKSVKQACSTCSFSSNNSNFVESHYITYPTHHPIPLTRNRVDIFIPGFNLRLENVSYYNRQPCRIQFSMRDKKELKNCTGLFVAKPNYINAAASS